MGAMYRRTRDDDRRPSYRRWEADEEWHERTTELRKAALDWCWNLTPVINWRGFHMPHCKIVEDT